MLKTGGMGMVELGWLSAVPYLAAVIAEFSHRRLVGPHAAGAHAPVWPCLALGGGGLLRLLSAGHVAFLGQLCAADRSAGAMMYAPYGPFFAYLAESLPSNVAGGAIALINSMGALGSFVGAYGVGMLNGITGSSGVSYLMMAAALIVSRRHHLLSLPGETRLGLLDFGLHRGPAGNP